MPEEPVKRSFPKLKIFSPEKDGVVIVLSMDSRTDALNLGRWLETEHELPGFELMWIQEILVVKASRPIPPTCFPMIAKSQDETTVHVLDSRCEILASRKASEIPSSSPLYIPLIRRN